jgi:hypothetical protein
VIKSQHEFSVNEAPRSSPARALLHAWWLILSMHNSLCTNSLFTSNEALKQIIIIKSLWEPVTWRRTNLTMANNAATVKDSVSIVVNSVRSKWFFFAAPSSGEEHDKQYWALRHGLTGVHQIWERKMKINRISQKINRFYQFIKCFFLFSVFLYCIFSRKFVFKMIINA